MKTLLWAMLSANGNYAQRFPPKAAIDDFTFHCEQSGNFIAGRHTFDLLRANASRRNATAINASAQPEVIVLSSRAAATPGVTVVRTPREALRHLSARGYQTALIAGGARTHNAFLAERLVDELIFDVAPMLEAEGLKILLPEGSFAEVDFLASRELGAGVVQLRYAMRDKAACAEIPT